MRNLLNALLVATAAISTSAVAQDPAPAASPAHYSVDETDLGSLLDDPGAKAALEKHLPDLVGNPQVDMARGMTLRQLQSYAGDQVTDEALAKVQADLEQLPAKP